MGAAPPAGGVGGIAAVGRPAVRLVLLKAIEPAHVLRIAHCLEGPHIFAAGKHVCAPKLRVDLRYDAGHVFLCVQLQPVQNGLHRRQKIPPDQGHIGDLRDLPDGNVLRLDDLKALLQQRLAGLAGIPAVKEDVEGIVVPVFRINAVCGEAAAQTVGAVMHGDHALHDLLSRHPASLPGDHSGDRASGRDADLPFSFHDVHLPQNGVFFRYEKRRPFFSRGPRLLPKNERHCSSNIQMICYHTISVLSCQSF